ncbi:response regulator transcription factor [Mangrovibacter yixingensis]|uniref:response regulator transcription factor n=1 Tax=Mangrovibacter yixingensis TaxID=1529639 RepID=UPI001CF94748|nr:DNA-binding response regulator [Mangrovibacter yixingensis]
MSSAKPTVLIVDDDINTVSMLNDTLDEAGFTVLVALEGSQALSITRQITPDIILLDAVMPHLDGFETSKRLRESPALWNTPIIFMTGLSDTDNVVNAFDAGVVDYVVKPIRMEELLVRMRTHLRNSRLTTSAYSAMDFVGQTMCVVNQQGQLLWATPNAWQLMRSCCDENFLPTRKFINRMLMWLNSSEGVRQALDLSRLDIPLKFYFSRQTGEGECLLRIEEINPRDEDSALDTLRANLSLTPREAEVLLWIARGKTNREIGDILHLSPRTVNKHLELVFPKLAVDNRTAAAAIALNALAGKGSAP